LHPATLPAPLVCLDISVYPAANLELIAPSLASGSQFLEFGIWDLEVVLVNNGLVVEEERHRRVEIEIESFCF